MITAFLSSLLVLVYTYLGYPVLITLLARFFPLRLIPVVGTRPFVSVLIPVYNGEAYIKGKLDSLLSQDYPPDKLEILLCSDCSEDNSDELLREYEQRFPEQIRVFRMEERSGKPTLLNRLKREARGEVLLMTDIRQPLEKSCVTLLVAHLADRSVGVAGGQLLLQGMTGAGLYWKYEKHIRLSESSFRSVTGVSGSLYVIAAADMPDLPSDIILDDVWVPSQQLLKGKRVVLVPEAIAWDEALEDDREFGRKIRTLAGNYQLMARLPMLLSPLHNPVWFEFVSHKVMRLLCPWALLALLVSSAVLVFGESANSLWPLFLQLLLMGQLVFYLLALLGEKGGRLGKLARTFVVLNIAALIGLWRYLRGRQKIAW
ncbi:MAG TPA: glycosyltransferase family 2 protein [Chromatiaceae bacterium]|nr:glycosyltransferase family 2 protein [Chromatiaceae bacterium]